MSELFLIQNFDLVREVLTSPEIYPSIGDDFAPDVEEFEVNEHPGITYLGVCGIAGLIGMFSLFPENTICWQVHVVMLPWATIREKWQAARVLPGWLARNTECKRLTAAVPSCNRQAIVYGTHGIGMRYVGRQQEAFMKHGKLEDLIILGRPIGG